MMRRRILVTKAINFIRQYSNRNVMILHERGMYEDIFPETSGQEVTNILNAKPQCVYAGFDPTADSLHVGNLLVLINLLHWQRGGHQVVVLVGGATGRIGDPSGHTSDRPALKAAFVNDNVQLLKEDVLRIFRNHERYIWQEKASARTLTPPKIVNNVEWYEGQNVVDFVGRIGRHFRMGTMLGRHSVQLRLASDAGMSFTEFCYPLFQAYDWLHLFNNYDCRFQIGGSDQMGNIVAGHDLISRVADVQVYGLTLPLIMTETGNKFGKTAGGAVWLNGDKSSPFELYQFFVRCRDSEVERLLKLFTFKSLGTIQDILRRHQESPELRTAQKILAEQVTLLVHGEEGLQMALKATAALYEQDVDSLVQLNAQDISNVFAGAKLCEVLPRPGTTTMELALKIGCFPDEKEATRIITAGGFYINHQRVTKTDEVLTQAAHVLPNNVSLIRVGKKNYYIVRWLQ